MSHEYRLWVQDRSNNSSRDISSYHSNFTAQTTYSLARTGRSSSRISSYELYPLFVHELCSIWSKISQPTLSRLTESIWRKISPPHFEEIQSPELSLSQPTKSIWRKFSLSSFTSCTYPLFVHDIGAQHVRPNISFDGPFILTLLKFITDCCTDSGVCSALEICNMHSSASHHRWWVRR
jgi:hypothetical protein